MTKTIKTDVLVIGGGLSGCMAAINAADHGAKVAIMEKSHTERSGAAGTGNDHFWFWDPEIHTKRGWTIPDMVRDISFDGEYGKTKGGLMDQELLEIVAEGTKEAVDNLESWGVQFRYDEIYPWNLQYEAPDGEKRYRIVPQFQSEWDTLNYDGREIKRRLTEQCLKRGVEIYNRVSGTGLLTVDGKVVGATGVNMRTGEFHVFRAKAVIMATGMDQMRLFRAQSGDWFNSQSPPYITGDGEAMALRAGAEVFILQAGKSRNAGFQYFRNLSRSSGTATTSYPAGRFVNSEEEVMIRHPAVREPLRKRREEVERSIAEGKTPFYLDLTDASEEEIRYVEWSYGHEGLCWVILEIMKDLDLDFRKDAFELELELEPTGKLSGGFLALFIDTDCRTNLPGLYACSPVQFAGEVAAPTYVVLGWRSGEKAAEYAQEAAEPIIYAKQVESEERRVTAPLNADDGHPWQEVNKEINNIMEEYKGYVAGWNLPGEDAEISRAGLENCIAQLEKLKAVEMKAEDPHELVRCNEVMNLMDIGIMMVKAALEPEQYERGAWFLGRQVEGEPEFRKTPIVIKYPSKGDA
ncbi:FAD-dependent oxidoreductase [Candidatus Bathyarchaeota archaeon]|nr:FAD-dependent oxidoreductase [Candidatus Bathyarchaeota archaeon]